MKYHLLATCPEETKSVLVQELEELGATNVRPDFKVVYFDATPEVFYEAHLKLRTASRILRILKESAGASKPVLFSQAKRINWTEVFDSQYSYVIEGVQGDRGPDAMKSNDISKTVKEAMLHVFNIKGVPPPKVDLKEPKVTIVAFIHGGRCTISVDTSGKTMHKRGYKMEGHPAPLKETLAASILKMAGYNGTQNLYDPMCGSGTIVIEGAMMALNKAALIHRKKGEFGFEWLKDFNRQLWRKVQDQIRDQKEEDPKASIFASDIDRSFVTMAQNHALRARVEKYIDFKTVDFFKTKAPAERGLLITNLPYGERIGGKKEDLTDFYKLIGDTLKKSYQGWTAALMVAEDSPYKAIGLKPSKKIPILNGSIKCRLLIFELYAGTKKAKKSETSEED